MIGSADVRRRGEGVSSSWACLVSSFVCLGSPLLAAQPELPDVSAHRSEAAHRDVAAPTDYEEIVVSASPHPRQRFDVIQGTVVLANEELDAALRPTLGDTLAELPGITSSSFGPGASRPVIRGLDGPRVRVLQDGIGIQDASVSSPDHAVAMEPLLSDRIEVVRGAATLRYGSSAIGGVVNVDDGRIPRELNEEALHAELRALYGSASQDRSASLGIGSSLGPLALRAAGFLRGS
ncbi:MAG: TonB-dependent receptor plug domain-containing protein, partial [Myxococcales bacterium]|nr:TonB-dependent receptor plug domain-containing protein [Myxococcales bacterium]